MKKKLISFKVFIFALIRDQYIENNIDMQVINKLILACPYCPLLFQKVFLSLLSQEQNPGQSSNACPKIKILFISPARFDLRCCNVEARGLLSSVLH